MKTRDFVEFPHGYGTSRHAAATVVDRYRGVSRSKGDPFYERLNEILGGDGFDEFVEKRRERHYAQDGRPGLAPGRYFRCLLIGYFEGLDSERTIPTDLND